MTGEKVHAATAKKIEREIEEHKASGCQTFLPDEYRRRRLEGRTPAEIGYDECHIWR